MRICRLSLVIGLALAAPALADDSRIRVLVIDTGLDLSHPQLREVACPAAEHLNAVTGLPGVPADEHGHGTHVAGIIRALAGSKGYCIASCKFYSGYASANVRNSIRCLEHARKIGAKLVNFSAGGPEFSEGEYLAIMRLGKGAVLITAAGNDGTNLDRRTDYAYYPGAYNLPNTVVIGGLDYMGRRVASSNYGKIVRLQFPGENVYSSLPNGKAGYMTGTSQATAVGTGVALRTRLGLPMIKHLQEYWKLFRSFWN